MNRVFSIWFTTLFGAAAACTGATQSVASATPAESVSDVKSSFVLTSADLKDGDTISNRHVFQGFGCSGENVSPQLSWTGAPEGTKSFAVTVYDPDAKTGSGWWHWVVFNLPAEAKGLEAGEGKVGQAKLASGAVQSRTDFGGSGFGGPCPPAGSIKKPHHYIFTVYALKDTIPLDENVSGALAGYYIQNLKIGEASFTTRYGR